MINLDRCPRCGQLLEPKRDWTLRCTECLQDWHIELVPGKASGKTFQQVFQSERTKAGIALARKRGQVFGRPRLKVDQAKILELRSQGVSTRKIAEAVGVSQRYIVLFLREHKISPKSASPSPF